MPRLESSHGSLPPNGSGKWSIFYPMLPGQESQQFTVSLPDFPTRAGDCSHRYNVTVLQAKSQAQVLMAPNLSSPLGKNPRTQVHGVWDLQLKLDQGLLPQTGWRFLHIIMQNNHTCTYTGHIHTHTHTFTGMCSFMHTHPFAYMHTTQFHTLKYTGAVSIPHTLPLMNLLK